MHHFVCATRREGDRTMYAPTTPLPPPVATDPPEVADALDVAHTLWERGDKEDAVRWIRRAAEAAGETAEPTRMAALARAAADLAPTKSNLPIAPTSQIRLSRSAPPRALKASPSSVP